MIYCVCCKIHAQQTNRSKESNPTPSKFSELQGLAKLTPVSVKLHLRDGRTDASNYIRGVCPSVRPSVYQSVS